MTLGDWLNQMILEEAPPGGPSGAPVQAAVSAGYPPAEDVSDDAARVAVALERLTSRIEAAEHRSTLAISGIDQSVVGLLSRLEGGERQQVSVAARFEGALEEVHAEQNRVAERLARCEEQAAAPKQLESLRALESALGKVASQLYDTDSRTKESIDSLRGEIEEVVGKVERLEARGPGMVDTALIDGVVSRIVQRLETAEARTSSAIRGLESSFADLDTRLRNTEHKNGHDPEERLQQLASDLARQFEDARSELAHRLHAAADDRLEAIERSMLEMSEHVSASERRSARAIETMGHEVLRMAEGLGSRMQGVETRSTRAIEQVGSDVARIADTVEQRFRRADMIQQESLERLGGEIARISERLSERIGNSERRAAQAIDDVGEQVTRVTERITQKQERASEDLAERIRQSEERTARLLEEARERIDARLAETQRRLAEAAPPPIAARVSEPEDFELYRDDDLEPGPFGRAAYAPAAEARAAPAPTRFAEPFEESAVPAEGIDPFAAEDDFDVFDAPEGAPQAAPFAAAMPPEPEIGEAPEIEPFEAPEMPEEPAFDARPRPSSTRDMIEQARAAARAAHREEPQAAAKPQGGGAGGSSLFGGLKLGPKKKSRSASTLRTALMASATAAALGLGALGYTLITAQSTSRAERAADRAAGGPALDLEPARGGDMAATAVSTQGLAPGLIEPASAPSSEAAVLYAEAVRRIEAKDFSALAELRRAANLGHPQAQFYLGKLYEAGDAGLKKDMGQARQWTERAAQNGDRKAMHNLALYYFEGAGGPKNATAAAQWFRRASDLGLVDSQYNLARLYEEGFGVGRNTAEAYKWYLIAGRAGDAESRKSSDRLRGQLSGDAKSAAERSALAFRPDTPAVPTAAPVGTMVAPAMSSDMALAQRALSKLGYYRGPEDGVSSPALRMAIAAYQKQQGLEPTGAMDAALAERFKTLG